MWDLGVDAGGTFTDCVAVDPAGVLRRAKVLSTGALRSVVVEVRDATTFRIGTDWGAPADFVRGYAFRWIGAADAEVAAVGFDPERRLLRLASAPATAPKVGAAFELRSGVEAPILAARLVTGTPPGEPPPPMRLRLATTRGTNALLERRGAAVALFVTEGFADVLAIGDQRRPDLFALDIRKTPPLVAATAEVSERLDASGRVLRAPDLARLRADARRLHAAGCVSAAVALLHSDVNSAHEQAVAAVLRDEGFADVALSSALAPFIGHLVRTETAVVDAYLAPVFRAYLDAVAAEAPSASLRVMTSAGGLVSRAAFQAKDALLSGPAGGVLGMAEAGRRAGFDRVVGFDMGGTSADVARFDGVVDVGFSHAVGGVRLMAAAVAVETVAAGGGSICAFARERLTVGPESAGARPGPACYGAGGPLTLTDVNLLLGRVDAAAFPIPLDAAAARASFEAVRAAVEAHEGRAVDPDALLRGFLAVADERMADAVRASTLRRGVDPRGYALVAFGGAGGQHACAVAERLGIESVVLPRDASVLSADGLLRAGVERFAARQVLRPLAAVASELSQAWSALDEEAVEAVVAEGEPRASVAVVRRLAELRFVGQEATLDVDRPSDASAEALRAAFLARYADVFGPAPVAREIEIVALRASARGAARLERPAADAAVVETIEGPAHVALERTSAWIPEGWNGERRADGSTILRRRSRPAATEDAEVASVRLELFTNRFRAVAEEMGEALRRTAVSVNIKERLDFSCGLLSAEGGLVVNAPHIPVHLGALGACVRKLIDVVPCAPGDVYVVNHPAFGGSHLPDVTVVTPVHLPDGSLLGFTASRAHHAELGGVRPGSMPPDATRLADEGVVIPPCALFRGGVPAWDEIARRLAAPPFPSRNVEDNLADLRAAVAANKRGADALLRLASLHGAPDVRRFMDALKERAGTRVSEALRRFRPGVYEASETLDDGTPLKVRIEIRDGRAAIDFAGSADVHPGNLNATAAVVRGVVMYVLRLLVEEDLPLNEGLLGPIDLRIPEGILSPTFDADPRRAPAVVGGNVETSQRLVDLLLKALGVSAASQGTMNNTTFGDASFGYYETVCGGAGAGPGWDGADAVHTHMTNTKITDVEVIERRFPVRIERFAVRDGSGGEGRRRGGRGVVRVYRFLAPLELSLLTQRRTSAPFGLSGGGDGAPGRQTLTRADGSVEILPSMAAATVFPGDVLSLETPGGGGYGAA